MTRFLVRSSLVLIVALTMLSPAVVEAGPWIFSPSYYSHVPLTPVPVNPRLQGGPYYSRPQGEYVNSGYRNLRSFINIRGQTVDQTMVYESWIQGGGQF